MSSYLRVDILTRGSVSKQEWQSRVHVNTKKPFVGSRQQEHRRVHSCETTCGTKETVASTPGLTAWLCVEDMIIKLQASDTPPRRQPVSPNGSSHSQRLVSKREITPGGVGEFAGAADVNSCAQLFTCLHEYCRDIARSLSSPKADMGSTVERSGRQRSSLELSAAQALLMRALPSIR